MLGLPRTVITPADQLQGHVGGWRNGFFVNDTWQASRNLTLSLGLRYELNTPVQTYAGLRLDAGGGLRDDHPDARFRRKGFEFHEPNNKDFAPRLGATYRLGEKTVVRAGYGIYYNPNQMNSFTFLTNNPPLAAVSTYTSEPANPTLSFASPTGVRRARRRPRHDLADAASAQRAQGSVELRRPARALARRRAGPAVRRLATPATWIAASSTTRRRPAPGAVDPRRPSQKFRSRRIIQNDLIANYDAVSVILRKRMSHGLQVDAHYTWSRTRDMATHSNGGGQTMDNYDIWARLRPGELGRPAPVRRQLPLRPAVPQGLVAAVPEVRRGGLAGVRRDDDPERLARQRHAQHRPGEHRHHGQQRPDLVGARADAELPAELAEPRGAASADQLLRRDAFALPAQFTFGNASRNMLRGPKFVSTDLSFMKNVPVGGSDAVPDPGRDLQPLQPGQLRQPQRVVRRGGVRQHHLRGSMRQIQLGGKILF